MIRIVKMVENFLMTHALLRVDLSQLLLNSGYFSKMSINFSHGRSNSSK